MKVSYQWLADYVDLSGYSASDLAEKLTRSGVEVDIVEPRNKGVQQVVVGYVKSKQKHPDADKLNVCVVDTGLGEDLQIVCGAKNVDAGQKVPVALVGATLPDGLKIKRAKLRGVESQGMICSAKELGMNDRLLPKEIQEGILVLPETTKIGDSILDVLGLSDEVLELDLTPNRSDCLSMIGVAYEIAAILEREVKLPSPEDGLVASGEKAADRLSITISAPELCGHYAARCVDGVQIGPSPLWLQNRLMAAGVRPINNIVDITNYVMLEYGQPLHSFDADKLEGGRIDVRAAADGERIVTLDDAERALDAGMLLITDGAKPIAIAGVMGGANSEVSESTTRIVLESARFAGSSVRRTSRQLGLRSEASLRFEKEVNPEAVLPALDRAASLICRYAGGQAAEGIAEASVSSGEPVTVTVSADRINAYLGTDMPIETILSIFDRLHFSYGRGADGAITVQIPSRRGDITRDVDLIEEVARLYGYDQIPTSLMTGVTTPGTLSGEQKVRRSIRKLLTQSGLHEVITYSFVHPKLIEQFSGRYKDAEPIALAIPMSEERSTLRTSLIPNLLETAVHNRYRSMDDVAVFEIGKVFITGEKALTKQPDERLLLSILWTGSNRPLHWSCKSAAVDFYDVKGLIEKVTDYFGLTVEYRAAKPDGYHPGRSAEIWLANAAEPVLLGTLGQLHPDLQRDKDLDDTYIAEIELDTLARYVDFSIRYKTLPRYPAMTRDLALVVDAAVAVRDMENKARETAGSLLESIQVFDIYTGDKVGAGKKSVALSLVYRHPDRTLTEEEVSERNDKTIAALEQTFGAELRK
ncbi:phenylalanine--tRNA ligase subunit beta [Paenibacillus sp. J2TS4]|uniref:phenylalanine--tRNA ligase subunit beta n=1 Tax=Paenibacillus sp. J2TS4 TaxID=2807194 RepID=UPI001B208B4C|nr:phenylalanine--tRNA ligase subunit beta [Paenibacillus sp. J2TS4]GIP34387.1 phenylalanine--tRNA ligase beta subunit [Paenibacillus sp. J2TS4]